MTQHDPIDHKEDQPAEPGHSPEYSGAPVSDAASGTDSDETPERHTHDAAITGPDGKGSATGANPIAAGDIPPTSSEPASMANTTQDHTPHRSLTDWIAGDDSRAAQASRILRGDISPARDAGPQDDESSPPAREEPLSVTFKRRMEREGRWKSVSLVRDQMMKDAKKAMPDIEARREWVYSELDRMYPPVQQESSGPVVENKGVTSTFPLQSGNSGSDSGAIQGLGDLPPDWPELPANASLATEVGWVQANRLRIVTERPGGATVVRLDQALSPAPSWAALGWLETSIRSYAKFVDVAAKVSGGAEDESAVMRRERRSIEEVRAILAEMQEAGGG